MWSRNKYLFLPVLLSAATGCLGKSEKTCSDEAPDSGFADKLDFWDSEDSLPPCSAVAATPAASPSATAAAAAPTLTSIAPSSGLSGGDTTVTLTGTEFTGLASVTLGGSECSTLTIVSATEATCVAPTHAAGEADVVVTDSAAQQATLAAGFIFFDELLITPATSTVAVSNSVTFTATGGHGTPAFSATNGTIDATTGAYVAPSATGTDQITVTDELGNTAVAALTVNPALLISPTTQTAASGGTITFTATGGSESYTYSVATGSGSISAAGVYTASGSSGTETIRVTDSLGNTSDATITVNPAAPSSLAYSASSYSFSYNSAIAALSPTVTGTVSSYSVSPSLPTGLSISATTGVISGTPTEVSSETNYTVSAMNAGGSTTATLAITVACATPGAHVAYRDTDAGKIYYMKYNCTGWTTPEEVATGNSPDLAIDSNGYAHITYLTATGNTNYATNTSGSFVTALVAAYNVDANSKPKIALDSNGKAHILYRRFDDGWDGYDAHHATNASGSWVTNEIADSVSDATMYTAIAVGSDNTVHFLFSAQKNPTNYLYYATGSYSGSWNYTAKETVEDSATTAQFDAFENISMSLDSTNVPYVTMNSTDTPNSYCRLEWRKSDGTWTDSNYANNLGRTGVWISDQGLESNVIIDASDKIHIAHFVDAAFAEDGDYVHYITNKAGSFVTAGSTTYASSTTEPGSISLTVDSSQYGHIAYGVSNTLKYATNTSGSWATTTLATNTNGYSSVRIAYKGVRHRNAQ